MPKLIFAGLAILFSPYKTTRRHSRAQNVAVALTDSCACRNRLYGENQMNADLYSGAENRIAYPPIYYQLISQTENFSPQMKEALMKMDFLQ